MLQIASSQTTPEPAPEAPPLPRKRGRPKGLPKTGGRKPGVKNWNDTEIRQELLARSDAINVLADIIAGRQLLVGPPGPGKPTWRYPTLDQRLRALHTLLPKLLGDRLIQEVTGKDGAPLIPEPADSFLAKALLVAAAAAAPGDKALAAAAAQRSVDGASIDHMDLAHVIGRDDAAGMVADFLGEPVTPRNRFAEPAAEHVADPWPEPQVREPVADILPPARVGDEITIDGRAVIRLVDKEEDREKWAVLRPERNFVFSWHTSRESAEARAAELIADDKI